MFRNLLAISLLLGVGVAEPTFSICERSIFERTTEIDSTSGLPLGRLYFDGAVINIELAENEVSRAYGLMNRLILPKNWGMLFLFDDEKPRSFWMKNTKIPLDILYLDSDGIVQQIEAAEPCHTERCPSYPSEGPIQYVLELAQGESERLGIRVGAQFRCPESAE